MRRLLVVALSGWALAGCAQPPAPPPSILRADLGPDWLRWPPNDGCDGAETAATLPPGTKVDRYGRDTGKFFATPGTSYEARALPYNPAGQAYTVFVVLKPLPVEECKIAAWFGEPGGGMQFKTDESAAQLIADGTLARQ
jgi:hypothetical protein